MDNKQAIQELKNIKWSKENYITKVFGGAYKDEICALDMAIEALEKQIPYKLTQIDKETLTGICKCGRVTEVIDCEHYCKYCGQKITK